MSKVLLILHVLAAVIAVGPVTVAASMFPAAARKAYAEPGSGLSVLRALNRICRVYAIFGIAVPFFGLATAGSMRVFGDMWVIVSIVLTAAAAGVLALLVLPGRTRSSRRWTPNRRRNRSRPGGWRCTRGCSTCSGPW